MIASLLLLFAQSGLELPPLGYFPARDGRVYPLYGMRGNLVTGEPLEQGVTAAMYLDGVTMMKSAAGVKVGGRPIGPDLLRTNRRLSTHTVWIAGAEQIVTWNRRFAILTRSASQWERIEFDGFTLTEAKRETIAAEAAAIDSEGRLWTASSTSVTCGERAYEVEAPVESLLAVNEGWVLIRAGERLYGAQCRSADLTLVPEPAP